MSYQSFLTHTIVIRRKTKTGEDGYNKDTVTWATSSTVQGLLQPRGGKELFKGEDAVISTHKVFLEAGADITESDRVQYDGKEYWVLLVMDPGGQAHHIEADLKLVE